VDPAADQPADKGLPAADQPADELADKPADKPADKAADPAADGDAKPVAAGPALGRDPLWARLLVVFGAVLALVAGGGITATKVLANRYDSTVKRDNLIAPEARAGGAAGGEQHARLVGPLNFLLIGSDARAEDPTAGARSDTIIVLHFPVTMDRAYLISIPRDLRVEIPPFAATGFRGSREKVNGAFEYGHGGSGGVQLLSATLSRLLGITFDGAAVIDFGGFDKVVRSLGGVDMCIDERTESHHVGHDKNGNFLAPWYGPDGEYRNLASTPEVYEVGCRHLAPWQALDYARQRKSIPDGDYGRQRHQQQLLKAMFDEARRQGIARNPSKLDSMIRAVGQSLTVDTNGVPLSDLVFSLRDVNPGDLVGVKVPSEPQIVGGISYVIALEDQARTLYDAIRDDTLDAWTNDNQTWINGL
jgi:LCP family protein required for cell wall assembly